MINEVCIIVACCSGETQALGSPGTLKMTEFKGRHAPQWTSHRSGNDDWSRHENRCPLEESMPWHALGWVSASVIVNEGVEYSLIGP